MQIACFEDGRKIFLCRGTAQARLVQFCTVSFMAFSQLSHQADAAPEWWDCGVNKLSHIWLTKIALQNQYAWGQHFTGMLIRWWVGGEARTAFEFSDKIASIFGMSKLTFEIRKSWNWLGTATEITWNCAKSLSTFSSVSCSFLADMSVPLGKMEKFKVSLS